MTWEPQFQALQPGGGVDRIGGVEDEVNGQGPKLGSVLVGFGAGRFDDGVVSAGDEGLEEGWGGVRVDNTVDASLAERSLIGFSLIKNLPS